MRNIFFTLFFVGIHLSALAQDTLEVSIDPSRFHVDEKNLMILCQDNLEGYASLTDSAEVRLLSGSDTCRFVEKQVILSHRSSYPVQKSDTIYQLFFTQLPVIQINSSASIPDEKKVSAKFEYTDDAQQLSATIGIETRGGFSQSLPKKTYDLEFWEDETGENSRDVQFGSLREDDDWVLDALFNEPLRIRSYVSHKLWLFMHTPTYAADEPEAKAGANVMWTELFLDGTYRGIYALSEQVDRKLLKLKKFKEGEIRGELFKGENHGEAIEFKNVPSYDAIARSWDGFELKYPEAVDTTEWTNLYRLVDFVVNSDPATFDSAVGGQFDLRNAIDYFIFLNLLRATDNRGKNIYVARYEADSPYFYVPWDLDGTWGIMWRGDRENITDDILVNGLYQRLIDEDTQDFNRLSAQRWSELRRGILHEDAIASLINQSYNRLLSNNIYEREQRVWSSYTYDTASMIYLKTWTEERLNFLDLYFDDLAPSTDDSLVLNTDPEPSEEVLRVYPNPAYGTINVEGNNMASEIYELINSYGIVVKSGVVGQSISTFGIPPGFYILRTNNTTQRIIIANQ